MKNRLRHGDVSGAHLFPWWRKGFTTKSIWCPPVPEMKKYLMPTCYVEKASTRRIIWWPPVPVETDSQRKSSPVWRPPFPEMKKYLMPICYVVLNTKKYLVPTCSWDVEKASPQRSIRAGAHLFLRCRKDFTTKKNLATFHLETRLQHGEVSGAHLLPRWRIGFTMEKFMVPTCSRNDE
jgi:hypothetical protein